MSKSSLALQRSRIHNFHAGNKHGTLLTIRALRLRSGRWDLRSSRRFRVASCADRTADAMRASARFLCFPGFQPPSGYRTHSARLLPLQIPPPPGVSVTIAMATTFAVSARA